MLYGTLGQMKVRRISISRYSLPLLTPLGDANHDFIHDFALITVRAQTADGLEGTGYTYSVGKAGGSAIAALLEDDLVPLVIDEDPRRTEALWSNMRRRVHYVGWGGPAALAISAMDIALWDLKAKAANTPLWRMLGGFEPRVPAYASGIDLHLSLNELEEQTRRNLSAGFRAVKMKVGRQRLDEDIERVETVRSMLGPGYPLMVDANTAWTVDEAIRAARKLRDLDVYWLEEPTTPFDVDGHVRIRREGGVPIATGESLRTPESFEPLISAGGVSFPEPDATNCGGVSGWMRVARLAEVRNLPVTSHGAPELHVSLLAAVPNASMLEIHGFELAPYLVHPMDLRSGHANAPTVSGHGVSFDWSQLRPHREE